MGAHRPLVSCVLPPPNSDSPPRWAQPVQCSHAGAVTSAGLILALRFCLSLFGLEHTQASVLTGQIPSCPLHLSFHLTSAESPFSHDHPNLREFSA